MRPTGGSSTRLDDRRVRQHHELLAAATEIDGDIAEGRAFEAQTRALAVVGTANAVEFQLGCALELLHLVDPNRRRNGKANVHENILSLFCFGDVTN